MSRFMNKWLFYSLIIAYSLTALIKLDYNYFFTDEILYAQRGFEAFQGIYIDNLQVPFLAKYLGGLSLLLFKNDIYLIRIPFVICFILTNVLLGFFLKKLFDLRYAIFGMLFYISSIIVFESNRMVMLEAPMHLFWITFLIFYYETFSNQKYLNYFLVGLFLGLSMATKFTSLILYPFLFFGFSYKYLILKHDLKNLLKLYLTSIISSLLTLIGSYGHMFLSLGIRNSLNSMFLDVKSTYYQRNNEGKNHLIGDSLYTKSPLWSYLYYSYFYDGILRTSLWFISFFSFLKVDFRLFFFGTFFTLNFILFLILGIYNYRYLATLYIPLLFLLIIGIQKIILKFNISKYLFVLLTFAFVFIHIKYIYLQEPTKYKAVYNYIYNVSDGFRTGDRFFASGSFRSLKWYQAYIPNPDTLIIRKDYGILCSEFKDFNYFIFDKEELDRSDISKNLLYEYVKFNESSFNLVRDVPNFEIYKRISSDSRVFKCPLIVD